MLAELSVAFSSLIAPLTGTYASINTFVGAYGYLAIFILMALEYASLPIPSEIVLPLIGLFAARGTLGFLPALLVVALAGLVGMGIDYFIAYYLGKDVVYKHASMFHIKKQQLDDFDAWFSRNGSFAVFIARLIPVARGLVSFPAGFAMMNKRAFFLYSFAGALIWDVALMLFGYYGLSSSSVSVTISAIAIFAVAIYIIYRLALSGIRKRK
ncbi:MAG: DedA family protein [Candidatus Micrarchaeota archaeon]|nr:DedA family protein [Candidatus Micrarchaeota archaeon]MDE1847508.1 DedA family protein [Candidatus Micrarchaeota archaeon]MDE1863856.1 DedA family protein [Candidatus Micrarchaeota archaeon]